MSVPPRLESIYARLLAESEPSGFVSLDALASALSSVAVTHAEIDAIIGALEGEGRRVDIEELGSVTEALSLVLVAARALARELGRTPSRVDIARRTGLSEARVGQALVFARVLQR